MHGLSGIENIWENQVLNGYYKLMVCAKLITLKTFGKILYSYCIYRKDCLNLPVVGFSQRMPSNPAFPTSFDLNLNKAPPLLL